MESNIYQLHNESVFLSDYEREIFEERAAIMEFDGGLDKISAEQKALNLILKQRSELQNVV